MHKILKQLGIFEKSFDDWQDEAVLEKLTMGRPLEAPNANMKSGIDGVWPQRPIVHDDFLPPVLHLDFEERENHRHYIVSRYLGQIATLTPLLAWQAKRETRLAKMSDDIFAQFLTETSFGQFVNLTLDSADRQLFAPYIKGDLSNYAKVDFSCLQGIETLPDMHLAPTITLLRRASATSYRVVAIHVGEKTFLPDDSLSWHLSKFFVLQGAALNIVLTFHPLLHFPGDTINALTQSLLPQGHLLYRLLKPHLEFTLGLHEGTMHNRRSVFHNSQRELFSPFPTPSSQIHKLMLIGKNGLAHNSSYPTYSFDNLLLGDHTLYGRFRSDWFRAIFNFVKEITHLIPHNDPYVTHWADTISDWLPYFPSGSQIFNGDRLATAVTSYICSVTIFHTADHYSYAMIPFRYAPLRLRIPSPDQRKPRQFMPRQWVHSEDYFRHKLCHAMFFRPVVIRSLRQARYGFRRKQAQQAKQNLQQAMNSLDKKWDSSTFPNADEIAVSLQY